MPHNPFSKAQEKDPETLLDEQIEAEDAYPSDEEKRALLAAFQELQDDRDQVRDQLMRTMADFQNYRKRTEAEKITARQFANERLVVDLLPVLDNFERTVLALQAGSSMESVLGGISAVERQLRSVLESHNVSRIKSKGEPFDPDMHEAIGTEESEEHPEDTVTQEVEPGYRMSDKVIRPARVRVSKKG